MTHNANRTGGRTHRLLTTAAVAAILLSPAGAALAAASDEVSWSPRSSERLIKLPATYLKKAVEQDYAGSPLAAALGDTEASVKLKLQTLEDLRAAIDKADGDLRVELRHQFLAEKQAYLTLVTKHQDLRRKRAETRIRLYERLLGKLKRERGSMTPVRVALIQKQEQAQKRFAASVAKVDTRLFRSALTTESRYAREYAKNIAAIERLVGAINSHPMNEGAKIGGQPVDKASFIRQLITDDEAEIALLDQEQGVAGFMAKLVALDALALSEAIDGAPAGDEPDSDSGARLSTAVDFFVTR